MIRILLYLLLVKVCVAKENPEAKEADSKVLKVAYYGPPGVPDFPHYIHIGDIQDTRREYTIHYSNVTFKNFSSVYSIRHRIDFGKQKIRTILTTRQTQLQGRYSLYRPSSLNKTEQDFEVNMFQTKLAYETAFQILNGSVSLGKTVDENPFLGVVHGNVPAEFKRYASPKLLESIGAKLNEEVLLKVNMTDVQSRIERHLYNQRLTAISERFKATIFKVLNYDEFPSNMFNTVYFDTTNFNETGYLFIPPETNGYEMVYVTIPSFTLHTNDNFVLPKDIGKITFAENGIHLHSRLALASMRVAAKIAYRENFKPLATTQTLEVEYQFPELQYEFRMLANLETTSVEVTHASARGFGKVQVANDPHPYGDDRDRFIQVLPLGNYIDENCARTFEYYMRGIMTDEHIAKEIFKDDHSSPTSSNSQQVPTAET